MWTEGLLDQGPLLLLLDFDGTLVPIAEHPEGIEVSTEVPGLLAALREAGHEVWIVTGRRADFVRGRLSDDALCVVGLHGLEWPGADAPPRHPALDELKARAEELRRSAIGLEGIFVEDKGVSVALHYRNVSPALAQSAERALRDLVRSTTSRAPALSMLLGHFVVEARPREASKANAVRRLVERFSSRLPVFVGDDVTDEEAFAALGPRGVSVRVGPPGTETRARLLVADVDEVIAGLRSLLSPRDPNARDPIARDPDAPSAEG